MLDCTVALTHASGQRSLQVFDPQVSTMSFPATMERESGQDLHSARIDAVKSLTETVFRKVAMDGACPIDSQ